MKVEILDEDTIVLEIDSYRHQLTTDESWKLHELLMEATQEAIKMKILGK